MKAAYLVGPQQFEVREVPEPEVPEDGVLLEVKACGVCGSDLRRWREGLPEGRGPYVQGHEFAGVVLAVGPQQKDYKVGDLLAVAADVHCGKCYYCQRGMYNLCENARLVGISAGMPGGLAQKAALSGDILTNGVVHRMPEGMSFEHAALAEPLSSVLAAHHKAETNLSHTVVVLGGGSIGCFHIAVAHARGAKVILSEPSAERRQMAEPFHPEFVIDPFNEDVVARVRELTGGLGADIVICANPIVATQTQAVEMVRKAGRVILFGGLPKANPMTSLNANRIHYDEIEVVGAFSYHPIFHEQALDVLQRGLIDGDTVITHVFGLDDVDKAFQASASGQALKAIVKP